MPLLSDLPGAKWWKLDIHAHSPASKDYGVGEGKDSNENKPTFREWLLAYIQAGVDGVVITDHNTHEGIEDARKALQELRQEQPDLPDLVIFPGVELTVAGGVHLLALFDPDTEAEIVNRLITRCHYEGTRGGSTETANITVSDAAEEITRLGGLCVPAHADKNAGIFQRSQLELQTLKSADIFAVEIVDDKAVVEAERYDWVALLGSDAHFLTVDGCPPDQEAKAPGTHFTWIKAEHLDLHGIRLALTDSQESVQRGRQDSPNPNSTVHGFIAQLTVNHKGGVETYRFNPWMNCLIGGRGVGKSTILELIRLAVGRSSDIEGSVLLADLQRFIPGSDRSKRWWAEESSIEIQYVKDGRTLRILWSGSKPENPALEAWGDSGWEAQAGHVVDRAPIQIFSQKQIYDLAHKPQSFLSILDSMEQIQKSEWTEEYSILEGEYRTARQELKDLLTQTERAERLRGQLEEVQGRLRHLEEMRTDPKYQELESIEAHLSETSSAEQKAAEIVSELQDQEAALTSLVTKSQSISGYESRAASFTAAAQKVSETVTLLKDAAEAWKSAETIAGWNERAKGLQEWLVSHKGTAESLSPERTASDRETEKSLKEQLHLLDNSSERVDAQNTKLQNLYDQIVAKREELFSRRAQYVATLISQAGSPTKVRVHHQAGLDDVDQELRRILNRPDSFDSAFERDAIPKTLFDTHPKNPTFAKSIVPKFKQELCELVTQGPESEIAARTRLDARFHRKLSDAEKFDVETEVLLWFPEDLVSVEYKPEGGNNFVPVDQGSPGQKTAALLAIILQMGTEPLLLDQPEDDLENKLIKNLAVETLKQIKRTRQLVVSTHNANIVVTSAAEHVMVIKHGENIPGLESSGTLQTQTVRDNVCLIVEGGEEAIKTRYRRLIG